GQLFNLKLSDSKLTALPFRSNIKIDHMGEREQIFEEAWRAINNGFYDPDFHDNNWEDLKEKYKPRAMAASTNADFQHTVNWMLGEINASHMGLYGIKNRYKTNKIYTGLLGIDIEPLDEGVKIKKVLKKSPADREESKLAVGDIITHIDGEKITKDNNYYSFLNNKANTRVVLDVISDNNKKRVVIRPTKSIRNLLYDDWVSERRRLTDKYSDGRLGYIHIRGMNWTSFEQFERELAANAYNKEGLIVDVRYNGGGWTTDYLMNILNVKQHAYTIPRGAAKNLEKENENFVNHYPYSERLPFYAWTKPSITLCNQNSYSNAEIFSHAYKNLGIGTLVGTPTFGAVISTSSRGLVDGSYIRLPFRAWYVKATNTNMENNPAVPDIEVKNRPDSKALGIDQQLKRSANELLLQIDKKR
ncbi:MAG: S41 family peptidase, partial [Bacteroidota bacterium]|nr:S41 family peptidase [Bacteroidota bacterium]